MKAALRGAVLVLALGFGGAWFALRHAGTPLSAALAGASSALPTPGAVPALGASSPAASGSESTLRGVQEDGSRRTVPATRVSSAREPGPEPRKAPVEGVAGPAAGGVWVRTVDARGEPRAGVPVVLEVQPPGAPFYVPLERAATASPLGDVRIALAKLSKKVPPTTPARVALDLPLEPRVAIALPTLDRDALERAGPFVLELSAAAESWLTPLRVLARDSRGHPAASVELELAVRASTNNEGWHVKGRATTDGDGVARFERSALFETMNTSRLSGDVLEFCVRSAALVWPSVQVGLSEADLAEAGRAIELTLPELGALEIEVVAAAGDAALAPALVSVEIYAQEGHGDARALARSSVACEGAPVRIANVGLGLDLRLFATSPDASTRPSELSAAGPRAAGEVRTLRLALGPRHARLTGRLLDADGTALGELAFVWALEGPDAGRRATWSPAATDAAGRFDVPFGQASAGLERWSERSLLVTERGNRRDSAIPRYARVSAPGGSPGGAVFDAGDLIMGEFPVLAAGRVVDESGRAVKGAWVDVRHGFGDGPHESGTNVEMPGRLVTDGEGRFEARSLQLLDEVEVSAFDRDGAVSSRERVRVPAAGLVLTLKAPESPREQLADLAGRLELDEGLPFMALEALLVAPKKHHESYVVGGGFAFSGVEAGTWTLEIRTYTTHWAVAEVPGIEISGPGKHSDPRLAPLDLRGQLRLLRLRIADSTGHRVSNETVFLSTPDGQGGGLRTDEEGRLVALVRSDDEHFGLSVSGQADAEITWAPSEQEVVVR